MTKPIKFPGFKVAAGNGSLPWLAKNEYDLKIMLVGGKISVKNKTVDTLTKECKGLGYDTGGETVHCRLERSIVPDGIKVIVYSNDLIDRKGLEFGIDWICKESFWTPIRYAVLYDPISLLIILVWDNYYKLRLGADDKFTIDFTDGYLFSLHLDGNAVRNMEAWAND